MSYLVDTNVLSELRKGKRCDPNVSRWFARVPSEEVYLSVLAVGEIRIGIERIRRRRDVRARALEAARVHGLTIASRDLKDMKRTGVACVDPFEENG